MNEERTEKLLSYLHYLNNLASEYPHIDFMGRVENVCDEIERELEIHA
jgi:hypothetical protein